LEQNWFNDVALKFSEGDCKRNFRLSKISFSYLVDMLKNLIKMDTRLRGQPLTPSEVSGIALWRLANGCSYRVVAQQFKKGISICWKYTKVSFSLVVKHLAKKYIRWPQTANEWKSVSLGFSLRNGNFNCSVGGNCWFSRQLVYGFSISCKYSSLKSFVRSFNQHTNNY
jgi:hypothetical protein